MAGGRDGGRDGAREKDGGVRRKEGWRSEEKRGMEGRRLEEEGEVLHGGKKQSTLAKSNPERKPSGVVCYRGAMTYMYLGNEVVVQEDVGRTGQHGVRGGVLRFGLQEGVWGEARYGDVVELRGEVNKCHCHLCGYVQRCMCDVCMCECVCMYVCGCWYGAHVWVCGCAQVCMTLCKICVPCASVCTQVCVGCFHQTLISCSMQIRMRRP